jgi:hypothetical protein
MVFGMDRLVFLVEKMFVQIVRMILERVDDILRDNDMVEQKENERSWG